MSQILFALYSTTGEVEGDASKQSLLEKADNEAKQVTISDSLKIPAVWIVCKFTLLFSRLETMKKEATLYYEGIAHNILCTLFQVVVLP